MALTCFITLVVLNRYVFYEDYLIAWNTWNTWNRRSQLSVEVLCLNHKEQNLLELAIITFQSMIMKVGPVLIIIIIISTMSIAEIFRLLLHLWGNLSFASFLEIPENT